MFRTFAFGGSIPKEGELDKFRMSAVSSTFLLYNVWNYFPVYKHPHAQWGKMDLSFPTLPYRTWHMLMMVNCHQISVDLCFVITSEYTYQHSNSSWYYSFSSNPVKSLTHTLTLLTSTLSQLIEVAWQHAFVLQLADKENEVSNGKPCFVRTGSLA